MYIKSPPSFPHSTHLLNQIRKMEALKGKIHGKFHSVKEEAEAKAERLKDDVRDLLHVGHKGIVDIVDSVHSKKDDGEGSVPLETSIPVVEENSSTVKEDISTVAVKAAGSGSTSEPSAPKKDQCDNKFCEFFANIFEKCCAPFCKKKD